MVFVEVLLLLTAVAYVLYRWATLYNKTFEERGVPYEKPWPLAGNALSVVLNKESFLHMILKFYEKSKTHKVYGFFNFRMPVYVINDPELIKKIAIKDFEYFPNHAPFFNTGNDAMLEGMLTIMKDQRWKDMRSTLSPVFTASKMRTMFGLMNEGFEENLKYLRSGCEQAKDGGFELELKQCFTRLSNDIIATTAFGLKVNSFENLNNDFYRIGQSLTIFRGKQMLKFMMSAVAPKLMDLLNIKVFEQEQTDYFKRIVADAMRYRAEHNIVRPDMIQMLMEAKRESAQHWSDEELAAQCFIFFFAAFENNANLICVACHELMHNPEVQQRLYEEAVAIRDALNGAALGYDEINKMKYLDQVVSETMRLWSLASFTDRVCSKDYTLKDESDKVVFDFKVGDRLWFPLAGLQRDPKYFEQPEVFDPERFSDENKHKIQPFTFIPFGAGPRVCIGNRYALMQAKAMLYYLVLEFKLTRAAKTSADLMKDIRGFAVNPENGFWMKLVPRK